MTAIYAARVFTHPGEWLAYEGPNLFHAWRLGTGGGLYRDALTDGALTFPIYPPGMYALWAPFVRWTGLAMWPGRLLSVMAMVVTLWALLRICEELGASRPLSAAGALSFGTFPGVGFLAWGVRPDGLAVALGAVALLIVTRWEHRSTDAAPVLVGALMVAMVFTKHNFSPVAVALGVAFGLRDRRAALRYTITVGGLGLAALVLVQSTGPFVQNMTSFAGGTSVHALADTTTAILRPYPHPGLILGVVGLAVVGVRAVSLVWVAGIVVLLSAVKIGSSLNYGLVLFLSSAVLLSAALRWIEEREGTRSLALASAVVAFALVPPFAEEIHDRTWELRHVTATQEVEAEAIEILAHHRGRVVGDRDDLILRAGSTPELEPFVYSQLAEAGEWDPAPLAADLDAHRVAMVQTRFDVEEPIGDYQGVPIWPVEVVEAVRRSYCPIWHTEVPKLHGTGLWLYEPCGRSRG